MKKKIGKALVVGAGISGFRAALDLAETGYGVTLIDRAPRVGGLLSQLDYQFPTNHCGMCKMLPLVERDASSQFCLRKGLFHENIDVRLHTEIVSIDGEPGRFTVSLKERPSWVDPDLCVGCGLCRDVCPVEVPDPFNEGLTTRKAIDLPVPHQIPNPYIIDLAACTHCGECTKVCPTNAIRLSLEKRKEFRILVVDDERIVRDSLSEWLLEEGFSVETAASGSEALEKLSAESFPLMLTDIKMPGMDGVQLLQKALEVRPDMRVLMMTAYATVETAVEAMKIGALDYLVKPFDPEKMIPKVVKCYEELEAGSSQSLEVGSVVFCPGAGIFDPVDEKNEYGYGINPNVITSLELERILSGTGPSGGALVRPRDGQPVRKIAWFQCVGSRNVQCEADFCSSICCMFAIKEALLAKERGGKELETAIFYMDMRTVGKSFQRYREQAETESGVRFERARIHSLMLEEQTGETRIRYAKTDGSVQTETFDLVVLAVGQRPANGTAQIAELADFSLNSWGFVRTDPFFSADTGRQGLLVGGSFPGMKDISESVIHASAASVEASRIIHGSGGGLAVEPSVERKMRDVSREPPRVLVALCSCGGRLAESVDLEAWTDRLEGEDSVQRVVRVEQACTAAGWESFASAAEEMSPNRILLGACHPYLFIRRLKALGERLRLDPALMDVADVMTPLWRAESPSASPSLSTLRLGLSKLRNQDPAPMPVVSVHQRALVVGGGIAGMHAALAIADHGYPVDVVEKSDRLGGNLHWLTHTIEGEATGPLLESMIQKVEKHPNITVHLQTRINGAFGQVGGFYTTVEGPDGTAQTMEHGTVILSTGGGEARTKSYGCGRNPSVITQKELETRLARDDFDPRRIGSVVMIQCVDSREEPRNYCSRVCCPASLKHALTLLQRNPDLAVYILYRDMMTPGFVESYYTKAREAGVMFVRYARENKPEVVLPEDPAGAVHVIAEDPLLGRPLDIEADLVVLATGIVPDLPADLASWYGVDTDRDGFFQEAEFKWRPVDALKEGVFACGLSLSPRSIPDAIATAGAAAQRCLRILNHESLPAGKAVATIRHSLCSLCERCIETCPYGARVLAPELEKVLVNPAMCQGCGDCATVCPNSAAVVRGFTGQRVMDMIDSALDGAS